MGRSKEKQKRIGANEQRSINLLINKIKKYRIFYTMRNQRETEFNDRLMDFLRQNSNPVEVSNKKIPVATFVGETFRPEFYLVTNKKPICAVECKRLTDKRAKSRWKAGLSQALLYSEFYKSVIAVFLDFTKSGGYHKAFLKGNNSETRFAKRLREDHNIHLIVLKAE